MDECLLTRTHLESLTGRELSLLADKAGMEILPGLDRAFIIEKILEAEGNGESGPGRGEAPLSAVKFICLAPLPRQYNITYIKTLLRDPLWVFVFWEIRDKDRELYAGRHDFEGYFLRVFQVEKASGQGADFTVSVGLEDTAWYLDFPPGPASFLVELCARLKEGPRVLAVSKPFSLPALLGPPDAGLPRSPLADLSALDELPVLRSGDRASRVPLTLKTLSIKSPGRR